ncbi:1-phosphofructokinase family hexose kinase [Dyella caseinilytica]|uniref:Phosphofructokinase n=1 Tax=Dyella caseinilytica TaxID=1849581 RepID=A0ABX7GY35_9GAMM|nr:1-phosphofructokinase family hexose kinase [Dyella caseinilytica]QRN54886.1 1-phosphofructokinase family hexose kinase [Dyella caseinilytica]GFZ97678.1 tagatose-6-phosphate kinase [Dyella caseinilytica]
MITVAGFNTAIDRLIQLDALEPGEVHRARSEQVYPGGKGVHVAQTIAALGERVQLIGLVDAPHRNLICRRMSERGVLFHGVEVAGELRHCMALRDASGKITEILGQGPQLSQAECDGLLRDFRRSVDESDLVILSGSLPRGFDATTYAELASYVKSVGLRCLIDASGAAMRHAVEARPFLIKPNRDEISELHAKPVCDLDTAVESVRSLLAHGVSMPVVTLGALGAMAGDANGIWHAELPLDQVRNTVGSGDCLLAGLAVGVARDMSLEDTLRLGTACGAANAQGEETGFVERRAVEALLPQVRIQRLA